MRRRRTASVLLALAASSAALLSTGPAGATATGSGGSEGTTEALRIRIADGTALDLRALLESSTTSNDPAAGTPVATERVLPLLISSGLAPALDALSTPTVEATTTGPEQSTTAPGLDLGALTAAAGVPGVLAGTVEPTALRAAVDAAGSDADAVGGASDLAVLGGVLRLGQLDALLGSDALVDGSMADRALSLDRVEVLDLGAVLQLLGLDIADLPLGVAAGLLQALGIPLPGGVPTPEALIASVQGVLGAPGAVPAQLPDLQAQLSDLQAQLAALPAVTQVCTAIDPLLGLIPGNQTCQDAANPALATIQAQIDAVTAQLSSVLGTATGTLSPVLGTLDGLVQSLEAAPLLVIEDLVVGATAEALDTLDASSAVVTGSVGTVQVGQLPPLSEVDAVALADATTATLGQVLSVIDPALASLVDVELLSESTSVRADGARNVAEASVTGLRLRITPPDLCAVLGRLGVGAPAEALAPTLGGVLAQVGQALPPLPLPVADVLDDLGSTLACTPTAGALGAGPTVGAQLAGGIAPALTQPLTVEALTVTGRSAFTPATTQVQGDPLARTGSGVSGPALLLALAAALAARRFLLRST